MEELQVIETTSGRQFKPWASREDVQAIKQETVQAVGQAVQDPASVTAIASEIASGKQAIASAINTKGVSASATESFQELAQDIQSIQTQEITIDGGDMYAKQLYGVANNGITPGYWNLYQVMADLLSDVRLSNYGGILLAEYYKGYDSIALNGAGSGGAYVVSDTDSNGQFIMHTADVTHTWALEDDGKADRWVAYCFASEGHEFVIDNTNTSPRKIHIGRNVGMIRSTVAGRVSEIVVEDGNSLYGFDSSTFTQRWSQNVVIRNLSNQSDNLLYSANNVESLYISGKVLTGPFISQTATSFSTMVVDADELYGQLQVLVSNSTYVFRSFYIRCRYMNAQLNQYGGSFGDFSGVKNITITAEKGSLEFQPRTVAKYPTASCAVFLNYINNDKTKAVSLIAGFFNGWGNILCLYLQNGWNKPLVINAFTSLTEANIYTYILQRLKQDVADCGDGVTITLGAANLAKLTSAESVQLLDDLTNIYGYTFA